MTCDHAATRASFAAFFGATRLIGGQDLPGEGWVLMGNCVACNSTLSIPIAEPRGNVVHGEIATDEPPPVRFAPPDEETSDDHAKRLIR